MEHIQKKNEILSIRNPYNQVFQQVKTLHQEKEDMLRLVIRIIYVLLTMRT